MAKPNTTKNAGKNIDKDATSSKTDAPLTDKEAKEAREKLIRDTNNAEMKAAKGKLKAFTDTAPYAKLPKDVQEAITRVIGKAAFGGGGTRASGPTFVDTLIEKFADVGTAISELDIFKETKMGRSEFRKRVREALKKAVPAARRWIEFNEDTESWVLLAVGADQPKAFKGKSIEESIKPKVADDATETDPTPAKDDADKAE